MKQKQFNKETVVQTDDLTGLKILLLVAHFVNYF